jgi:hypothetical protein
MATGDRTVRLAGSVVDCSCHVCKFFQCREDEHEVALPFIREGLKAGEFLKELSNRRPLAYS